MTVKPPREAAHDALKSGFGIQACPGDVTKNVHTGLCHSITNAIVEARADGIAFGMAAVLADVRGTGLAADAQVLAELGVPAKLYATKLHSFLH